MLIGEVVISAMALSMVVAGGGTNRVDAYRLGDYLFVCQLCSSGRKENK